MKWFLAYWGCVNGVTFLAYGFDKWAAKKQWSRIPETHLHVLALLGGSPAAFLSQRFFRHKTVKGSFQLRFWCIVLIQTALIVYWIRMFLIYISRGDGVRIIMFYPGKHRVSDYRILSGL